MGIAITRIAVVLAVLMGGFQNCEFPTGSSLKPAEGEQRSNNGDGYTGKGTYVQLDANNSCGDGSGFRSIIELVNGKGFQIKRDCAPVPREEIPNINWMPHNLDLLFNGSALFQNFNLSTNLDLGCRGRSTSAGPGGHFPFADIQLTEWRINSDGNREYRGAVKTGAYDAQGNLLFTQDVPVSRAEERVMPNGARSFMIFTPGVYDPASGLPPPPTPPNPPMNLTVQPDLSGALLFPAPELNGIGLIVPNMSCGLAPE